MHREITSIPFVPRTESRHGKRKWSEHMPRRVARFFGLSEFRAVCAGRTNLLEFGVKRLGLASIAGGPGGASSAQQAIEAVRRILEGRLVFGQSFSRTLEFKQHVRQHFARGDAHGFSAIFILTISGGAQLLKSFVRFSVGEGQPSFGFPELGGFFGRDAVALFSRALLAAGHELRELPELRFHSV